MKRLVQILVVAAWIVGSLVGDLPDQPSASAPADDSVQLLVDTNHARFGVDRNQVVVAVETPWHSEWRVTAPMPERLAPNRPEAPGHSQSDPDQPSIVSFLIRFRASLP